MVYFEQNQPEIGSLFNEWLIIEKISESKFSSVYKVKKRENFGILKFAKDLETWDYIKNELEIIGKLQSYNNYFPKIIEKNENQNSLPWFIIEFFPQLNLYDQINKYGPLDQKNWFEFAKNLFGALSILEELNISHEDIKPSNIFYDEKNNTIKIIDFGLSRSNSKYLKIDNDEFCDFLDPLSDNYAGTPEYSSPEHFADEHVPKMDVFSAASTLVFAARGTSPFAANSQQGWFEAIDQNPPNLKGLSDLQIRFLNPLFPKIKSLRKSATEALRILKYFIDIYNNENRDKKKNKFFKIFHKINLKVDRSQLVNWPRYESLDNTNVEVPDVNTDLFSNRKLNFKDKIIQIINKIKYKKMIFALLCSIIIVSYLFKYINDQNSVNINNEIQAKILDCVSFNLRPERNVRKSLEHCRDLLSLNIPIINRSFVNEYGKHQNFELQEKLLIANAKIDFNTYNIDLIQFYKKDDNYEKYASKWLPNCVKNNDLFCLKIESSFQWSKKNYTLARIHLIDAIKQNDYDALLFLNQINTKLGKPLEFQDKLENDSKKHWSGQLFFYNYFEKQNNTNESNKWLNLGIKNKNPELISIDTLEKYIKLATSSSLDYSQIKNITSDCLKLNYYYIDRYSSCYAVFGNYYDQQAKKSNTKSDNEKFKKLGFDYYFKTASLNNPAAALIVGKRILTNYIDEKTRNSLSREELGQIPIFLKFAVEENVMSSRYWLALYLVLLDKEKNKQEICKLYNDENIILSTASDNTSGNFYWYNLNGLDSSTATIKSILDTYLLDVGLNCSINF